VAVTETRSKSSRGAVPGEPDTAQLAAKGKPPRRSTNLVDPDRPDNGEVRAVRKMRAEDRFDMIGGAIAGVALATLAFGWFTPLTGEVGWVIVAYVFFLGIYASLISLRSNRIDIKDRLMTVVLYSAGALIVGSLAFVVVYTLIRGQEALSNANFFFQTMVTTGPLDPLDSGGVAHAIVGTLIQITIALVITIPLGITTAVFLNEVGGRFARFVRTISDAMTALPSIVAGLFVYAAIIMLVTNQRSGFAAALAITVMMLPIVIRAADVVLRLVPSTLREASLALGASKWQTVRHVVLPTAKSGLVTSVILGTARGIGETSPVLLTSGVTAVMNFNPFVGPMISLPLQVFDFVRSPEPNMIVRGFGTAAVLLIVVLALFTAARIFGGRGPGVLSQRQQRAALARSRQDLIRITVRSRRRDQSVDEQRELTRPRKK
jgi:phosphate transport system permease protein